MSWIGNRAHSGGALTRSTEFVYWTAEETIRTPPAARL